MIIIPSFETTKSCTISDDNWKRSKGGGGRTFIIEDGKFFDKAAINFSSISGTKLPQSARDNIKNKKATFISGDGRLSYNSP